MASEEYGAEYSQFWPTKYPIASKMEIRSVLNIQPFYADEGTDSLNSAINDRFWFGFGHYPACVLFCANIKNLPSRNVAALVLNEPHDSHETVRF